MTAQNRALPPPYHVPSENTCTELFCKRETSLVQATTLLGSFLFPQLTFALTHSGLDRIVSVLTRSGI